MKRALVAALATLLCVLGLSCSKAKDDAEIVIVVDTDFAVPQQLNEVSFYVKRVGADESLAQTLTVPLAGRLGKPLPLRLGIAPDSDLDAAVEVRVEGYLIADPEAPRPAPVVRRKARLRFQRGKVLLLRMDLVLVCAYPKYGLSALRCSRQPRHLRRERLQRRGKALDSSVDRQRRRLLALGRGFAR